MRYSVNPYFRVEGEEQDYASSIFLSRFCWHTGTRRCTTEACTSCYRGGGAATQALMYKGNKVLTVICLILPASCYPYKYLHSHTSHI